jgi:hypothetical protein
VKPGPAALLAQGALQVQLIAVPMQLMMPAVVLVVLGQPALRGASTAAGRIVHVLTAEGGQLARCSIYVSTLGALLNWQRLFICIAVGASHAEDSCMYVRINQAAGIEPWPRHVALYSTSTTSNVDLRVQLPVTFQMLAMHVVQCTCAVAY